MVVNGAEMLPGDLVIGWGGAYGKGIAVRKCIIVAVHPTQKCQYKVFTLGGKLHDVIYSENGLYEVLRSDT